MTEQQRNALRGIWNGDGLKVVYDIMEDVCNRAENDFISTTPAEKESVLAAHAVMHAQRLFMQAVITTIDVTMNEMSGVKLPNPYLGKLAALRSPLPELENDV